MAAKFHEYSAAVRAQTMYLINNDWGTLAASLRSRMFALFKQASAPENVSMRRLNHLVYRYRGLRIRELATLAGEEDFASAIFNITGVRLGQVAIEHSARVTQKAKRGMKGSSDKQGKSSAGNQGKGNINNKKAAKEFFTRGTRLSANPYGGNRLTERTYNLQEPPAGADIRKHKIRGGDHRCLATDS